MKKYIKDCSRMMTEKDIEIWKKGEEYFSKLLEIKYASKFERDGEWVDILYEEKEGELVHEAIRKFLDKEENFDKLCEDFFDLIEEKHKIQAKMLPALIIFDEIDNYPYIANDNIKRRLMRVRTTTHEEQYK